MAKKTTTIHGDTVDDKGVPDDWAAAPAPVEYASADSLLAAAEDGTRPEDDVYLPGAKTWVRIQALLRAEAIKVSETKGTADRERKIITWALVRPAMTYQEVERWHRAAVAGDAQTLVEAITRLSGLEEGARKEETQRFREEPES